MMLSQCPPVVLIGNLRRIRRWITRRGHGGDRAGAIGQETYAQCSACHGNGGAGAGNFPAFINGELLATFPTGQCQSHVDPGRWRGSSRGLAHIKQGRERQLALGQSATESPSHALESERVVCSDDAHREQRVDQ